MKKFIFSSFLFIGLSAYVFAGNPTTGSSGGTHSGGNPSTTSGGSTKTDSQTGSGSSTTTNTDTDSGNGTQTGINDLNNVSLNMMVYPNPADKDLYINASLSAKLANVKIFNSKGSIVFESSEKIQRIDLSTYPPGVYYFQATTIDSKKTLNKFIKSAN